MNNSTPIWGADNVLIISSGYNQGTRALRLTRKGEATAGRRALVHHASEDHVRERAAPRRPPLRERTAISVRRSLTALNLRTGEVAWQERGFGRSSFVYADGKAIILDEDGDLALARLSPQGHDRALAGAPVRHSSSWTAPTLVGTTLYARDRAKVVALNVGR